MQDFPAGQQAQNFPGPDRCPGYTGITLPVEIAVLSLRSLQVHLVAVSARHPLVDHFSVYSHPMARRFMDGITRIFRPFMFSASAWDLSLGPLTEASFEPLATCLFSSVSMKVAFLLEVALDAVQERYRL